MAPQSSKSLEPSECPPKKVLQRSRGDERVSKSLPEFTDRLDTDRRARKSSRVSKIWLTTGKGVLGVKGAGRTGEAV